MTQIIPSINVPTIEGVQERIAKVEPFVEWCHLDVTDGIFAKHVTWHEPIDLPLIQTKLNVEAHLMIERPEEAIEEWLVEPVKRVIVHLEATKDPELIIQKCREAGKEIGFAIKPGTFWGMLKPWFQKIDLVQALAVEPGPSGQAASQDIFDKIASIRLACPSCIIEIDGGMNPDTSDQARAAGADLIVAGSAIFSSLDIVAAIRELAG